MQSSLFSGLMPAVVDPLVCIPEETGSLSLNV